MKRSTSNGCIKSTDIYNFCSLLTIHLDIQSPGSEVTSTIFLSINSGASFLTALSLLMVLGTLCIYFFSNEVIQSLWTSEYLIAPNATVTIILQSSRESSFSFWWPIDKKTVVHTIQFCFVENKFVV